MQDIAMRAPFGDKAVGSGLFRRSDQTFGVNQTCHAHFCHGLDDAGTTYSCDPGAGCHSVKACFIRPDIGPDDPKARLFCNVVNFYPFNRTGGCALAGTDLRTLKCGAGGR